ncbi:MAG: transketolase family protein [Eubacteriales bacterium]|nr:transketolase family protein [Eubacteriales bacterium]MDD4474189.1 transketolase family protein [Eubacteriales bacterium]
MQNEKKATRLGYGQALADLGGKYNFCVLDADLSKSTMTDLFRQQYPDRFYNCGIAEQNMMSTAAGIATTGIPVFASTFAMFAAGRAYEQVRNSIAYPELNVKIGASHAGITVGEDGATHQCCEDIALMRTLPGMNIICPADFTEAYLATEAALKIDGPVYLRLGRLNVPVIFDITTHKFEFGKAAVIADGADVAIFATGVMVAAAIEARAALSAEGIDAAVVNFSTIKPLDEKAIIHFASKCGKIVTAEEHSIIGGLGSAVAEVIAEKQPAKLSRLGMNDEFGRSGKAAELLDVFGLNAEGIVKKVRGIVGK